MKLRNLMLMLCISALYATAQTVDSPTFTLQNNADLSIVHTISDNGQWAIVKGATTEQRKTSVIRVVNTTTKEERVVKLAEQTDEDAMGAYIANDITDDGNIVVGGCSGTLTDDGSYLGVPAYFNMETQTWTSLSLPLEMQCGYVTSVTPDGKYAVGFAEDNAENVLSSNSSGVMWNLQSKRVMLLSGLPTMPVDYTTRQETYSQISADGRYIVIYGNQSIRPTAFIYDRENASYIQFGKDGNNAPSNYLMMESAPILSPNAKFAAGTIRDDNDNLYVTVLNMETQTYTSYDNVEDYDLRVGWVDDNGNVYASSPSTTPLREWQVLKNGIWYPFSLITSQRYGFDFYKATGFDYTGTLWAGSADGRVLGSMVSPLGESYIVTMPEDMGTICESIDLLQSFTATPVQNSQFHWFSTTTLRFTQIIKVLGSANCAILRDKDGNVVRNSIGFAQTASDNHSLIITFRETALNDGETYTIEIPAGSICLAGNNDKQNKTISLTYVGREDKPVECVSVFPEENAELARIDNTSNFPVLTFSSNVAVTDNAEASLIEVTEDGDTKVASLSVVVNSSDTSVVGLLPSATQYLYAGANYKVVLEAGSLTDISNSPNSANEQLVINYVGTYERAISTDNATLFSEDFNNMSQSLASMIRYEGDHNTPTEDMAALAFDADNQPWNFSTRETESSSDFFASSHSLYDPAGQSDDWMVIPQLVIPDAFCTLSFDAQKYLDDKDDELKIVIWECNENFNVLTSANIEKMKSEGEILTYKLSIGETEEGIDGEWVHYAIDLAKYNGKRIYIGFWNNNNNQSMIFVDNIVVMRNLKYLLSLSNRTTVVSKDDIAITGSVKINSEIDTFSSITLTLNDAEGNTIDTFSQSGLSLVKNDVVAFEFANKLPLTVGEVNNFTIGVQLDDYTDVTKGSIQDLSFEPVKRVVLEEMTGITCVNCPQGILAIENLEKLFGDRVIPISLHTYTGDPYSNTALESYTQALGLNAAPSAMIQRNGWIVSPLGTDDDGNIVFSNGYSLWQDMVASEMDQPTYLELGVNNATIDSDTKNISFDVEIQSALNMKNQYINVFPVALEDGLVNVQENTFYNNDDPALGEWGKNGKYGVPTASGVTHNDVARTYWGEITGSNIGFPQKFEVGETYSQPLTLSYPENVSVHDNGKIVLMLIDGNTGSFINAVTLPFSQLKTTGINDVDADSNAANVVVEGNNVKATAQGNISLSVYLANGVMIASAEGTDTVTVSTGEYHGVAIVKVCTNNEVTTQKVVL
ncbi:MAG: choice-of-anchor J domain-containing protein [Muribaculaceae bacterium]